MAPMTSRSVQVWLSYWLPARVAVAGHALGERGQLGLDGDEEVLLHQSSGTGLAVVPVYGSCAQQGKDETIRILLHLHVCQ
jgi:hypothetical protein